MNLSRVIRIAIGVGIIVGGLILNSQWWVFGILPLTTGIINKCPSFLPFGQSACKIEPEKIAEVNIPEEETTNSN